MDSVARHASRLHYLGGVPVELPARESQCGRLEPRAMPWTGTRRYGAAAGAGDLWNLRGTHVGPLPLASQSKRTDVLVRSTSAAARREWSVPNRARRYTGYNDRRYRH